MTKFNFLDIVLINFRQSNNKIKKRPALVILDIHDDDIVLVPITSRKRTNKGDFKIKNWKKSNLLTPSWVRLAKPASFLKENIEKKLGNIYIDDKKEIIDLLNSIYSFK
jgi:hypothetical protein